MQLFRPDKPQIHNRNTVIDTGNVDLLNSLWDTYTQLAYRYNMKPTLQRFSVFTGISEETFASWAKQEYRASNGNSESYKKWRSEALAALYDSVAQTGNVGGIFLLKADYGFRETAPVASEFDQIQTHDSAEAIAQRHASARLPERPILDLEG